MEKKPPRKIHEITSGSNWTNVDAMMARAMEQVTPGDKVMVAWIDEKTKQVNFMSSGSDYETYFMCGIVQRGL